MPPLPRPFRLRPRARCATLLIGLTLASPAFADPAQATLEADLIALRAAQPVPGVAATRWQDGQAVALAVAGLRHLDEPEAPIARSDRFAIGSITKRLTALLVARLVDAGRLRWDLPLAEALPDTPMHPAYRAVTLTQLLDFTGGIAAYTRIAPQLTPELFDTEGSPAERKSRFVRHLLNQAPAVEPGTQARYSNASYTVVAAVIERATGEAFTDLMRREVFAPLGLRSAGWGRPRTAERPTEPWLHIAGPEGLRPEPDRELPPEVLFAAAGGAHMAVSDLARLAQAEIDASRGRLALLQPDSMRRWLALVPARGEAPRIVAGGTPWLAACYAVWPARGELLAMAVNGGTPQDAACRFLIGRTPAAQDSKS